MDWQYLGFWAEIHAYLLLSFASLPLVGFLIRGAQGAVLVSLLGICVYLLYSTGLLPL